MIKHSVSRVFEYLLEDEDNCIKGLAQEERDNIHIICKVGGKSNQPEFQIAATKKRGVNDCIVYCIVFVLLKIESGKKKIWKSCIPNSPNATRRRQRHLIFCFATSSSSYLLFCDIVVIISFFL